MASGVYNTFKGKDGNDWAAGADSAYKVLLVTSGYTPNPDDLHPNATGLASSEITGGTYARQNCASRTKAANNSTDKFEHSMNNTVFAGLSAASPKYAIIYRVVTNDTDHQLVAWIDLGTNTSVTGDFTVKWDGNASTAGVVFDLS